MKLEKHNTFSNDIIFIDGLWGTGKSLLGPIVSGMAGVEKVKIEGVYEYINQLFSLGKISEDGALWMLRTYADRSQYYNAIGREVNLRWSDDTGLRDTPDRFKYIRRLFGGEGDSKVEEIIRENLAFCTMSHMLMLTPDLWSLAYGKRVKVIEMVRHPLYMVRHLRSGLERFESPREFTMSFCYRDVKVPWFASGWEDEFIDANSTERSVLCITRLYPWLEAKIELSRAAGLAVLDLSFEEAVFETNKMLRKLEQFIGRKHHSRLSSILKRQMMPRTTIAKGKGHAHYGWVTTDESEGDTYEKMLKDVRNNCSVELQNGLDKIITWYNKKYPSRIAQFHMDD